MIVMYDRLEVRWLLMDACVWDAWYKGKSVRVHRSRRGIVKGGEVEGGRSGGRTEGVKATV